VTDGRPQAWRLRSTLRPAARVARGVLARARNAAVRAGGLPRAGDIRLSYGHLNIPGADQHAHGGIVKLQALDRTFGHARTRFNILYLVTSRLPEDPVGLADSARAKGAKIVVNQNGVAYSGWHGPGWERINRPMKELLARADHVFYQSTFCKTSADHFLGPTRAPHEVLYNPVDVRHFVPATAPRGLTILLAGTQDFSYKVTVAIDVLTIVARRVDAHLIVTGRLRWMSDERAAARAAATYAVERGVTDRVTFTGPYTQTEAPAIYQRAGVLLHPKYNDPSPGVVIEAMACGMPVVYSASGGVPELVGQEAGIGVAVPESWDETHLPSAGAMAQGVLDVFERRAVFSAAARQRAVDCFDVRHWILRHRQVFETLCQ
jgi:glycosyltransferase involved in cell wall biosynthesis